MTLPEILRTAFRWTSREEPLPVAPNVMEITRQVVESSVRWNRVALESTNSISSGSDEHFGPIPLPELPQVPQDAGVRRLTTDEWNAIALRASRTQQR